MEKVKNEINLSAELFFGNLEIFSRANTMELKNNEIITTRQGMIIALRNLADELDIEETVVKNEKGWMVNGFQYDKSYRPRKMEDKIIIKLK